MINISESAKQKYDTDLGDKLVLLELYEKDSDIEPKYVFDNDNIISESLELTETISTEQDIRFGQCVSTKFSIDIFNIKQAIGEDIDFIDYRIKVYIYAGGSYLYPSDDLYPVDNTNVDDNLYPNGTVSDDEIIPLFDGYIVESKLADNRNNRKITAYDILYRKLQTDITDLFWNDLIDGKTAKYIREKILTTLGIPFENISLVNDNIDFISSAFEEKKNKINARQALESILEILGCFGHINRYGIFTFKTFKKAYYNYPTTADSSNVKYPNANLYPGYQISTNNYISKNVKTYIKCNYDEYFVQPITGVSFIKSNNIKVDEYIQSNRNVYLSKGNIYLEYFMEGETIPNTISSQTFLQISEIQYPSVTLESPGYPYLEVGDYVSVPIENDDRKYLVFPILSRTLKGIQSLKDTFRATGKAKRDNNFRV